MTQVEIYNMALNHLAHDQAVTATTDTTAEATWCNRFYDQARQELLRLARPNWSRRIEDLEDCETLTDGVRWGYIYPRPDGCLLIQGLLDSSEVAIDYQIVADGIMANVEDARIDYVVDEDDTAVFDAHFVLALTFKLASYIAYPLTGKPDVKRLMEQGLAAALSDMRSLDANEDRCVGMLKDHNAYVTARG